MQYHIYVMKIKGILKYFVRFLFLQSLITFVTIWYFDNYLFQNQEHKFNTYLKLVEDRERFYNVIPLNWITIDGLIFVLVILPWLDTSKVRSAVFRPIYKQFYWFLVADVLILGYMGAMPAEGTYLLIARVATAYYFIHFLFILPFLGKREKTLDIPMNITDPVLGGSAKPSMTREQKQKL